MERQQKRLKSYLERRGLEVKIGPGADGIVLTETWGGLHTRDLMDEILERDNIESAIRQVVHNMGAEGMDGMSVLELPGYVEQHWNELYAQLRTGRYRPKPVRRVTIPKPDGGERNLGVPTVLDRMIQQAVAQVLTKVYEPKFSERSFGFRPGRSAHDAIITLRDDVADGHTWAVDIDLSKYFDTINHDILMNILRRDIEDETVLALIKGFLKSGVMVNGILFPTEEGSPQGGNLSPLLANIYLNECDRILEERGHRFVRYADDLMVLMKSRKGAERVMESTRKYLEGTLKLKVNEGKSNVAPVVELKYLGFQIQRGYGTDNIIISIHEKSWKRFNEKVKALLRKSSSASMEQTFEYLTNYLRGWLGYFGLAEAGWKVRRTASHIRRKVRAKLLKQWKRTYRRGINLLNIHRHNTINGTRIHWKPMWNTIKYDGVWRMSNHWTVTHILHNRYLESIGCPNMLSMYEETHSRLLNRRDTRVCPVV